MGLGPFIENEAGQFIPADKPESIAEGMSAHELSLRYRVEEWLIIESTSSPIDQNTDHRSLTFDKPPTTFLRVRLKNEDRRLHTIRAEGTTKIEADFDLDIVASTDETSAGHVRHHPCTTRDHPDDGNDEELRGLLRLPIERFNFIIERLKHPGARLALSIELLLYKPSIAHSFDRDWYPQDVYLKYDSITPITGYSIGVMLGALLTEDEERQKYIKALDAEESARDTSSRSSVTSNRATPSSPGEKIDRRMSWVVGLLAMMVMLELFKR
jgi:hypothetical protein